MHSLVSMLIKQYSIFLTTSRGQKSRVLRKLTYLHRLTEPGQDLSKIHRENEWAACSRRDLFFDKFTLCRVRAALFHNVRRREPLMRCSSVSPRHTKDLASETGESRVRMRSQWIYYLGIQRDLSAKIFPHVRSKPSKHHDIQGPTVR